MSITKNQQSIINETRRYYRALEKETRRAKDLNQRASALGAAPYLKFRPKAYQFSFSFEPGDKTAVTQTLAISEGKSFRAHQLSSSFSIVGQTAVDTDGGGTLGAGQVANITAGYSCTANNQGPSNRQRFFDFFWRLRDTSGDHEFTTGGMQPSVMLCGGHAAPLSLPVPMNIASNAQLAMDIVPIYNRSITVIEGVGSFEDGLANIKSYNLIVKLWGEEEV